MLRKMSYIHLMFLWWYKIIMMVIYEWKFFQVSTWKIAIDGMMDHFFHRTKWRKEKKISSHSRWLNEMTKNSYWIKFYIFFSCKTHAVQNYKITKWKWKISLITKCRKLTKWNKKKKFFWKPIIQLLLWVNLWTKQ